MSDAASADDVRHVDPEESPPTHQRSGAKINRNALLMRLHERGFIGVSVTMTGRDTALVDPSGIPEPRREVFDAWAADSPVYKPTDSDVYPWVVDI